VRDTRLRGADGTEGCPQLPGDSRLDDALAATDVGSVRRRTGRGAETRDLVSTPLYGGAWTVPSHRRVSLALPPSCRSDGSGMAVWPGVARACTSRLACILAQCVSFPNDYG